MTDGGASLPAEAGGGVRLTLLYRAYCHLCDEMLDALAPLAARLGGRVDVVDIDRPEQSELEARWGDQVPVLFAGDPVAANELCHYRLDAARVEAALGAVRGTVR